MHSVNPLNARVCARLSTDKHFTRWHGSLQRPVMHLVSTPMCCSLDQSFRAATTQTAQLTNASGQSNMHHKTADSGRSPPNITPAHAITPAQSNINVTEPEIVAVRLRHGGMSVIDSGVSR